MTRFWEKVEDFFEDLADRFKRDHSEHRRDEQEHEVDSSDDEETQENPKVVCVDFRPKENAANHNCEKYELVTLGKGTPIIRRGGKFSLEVELNQDVDLKKEQCLTLYLNFGPSPNPRKGTQAILRATGNRLHNKSIDEWDVRVECEDDHKVVLEVQVPPTAPVGLWKPIIEVSPHGKTDFECTHIYRPDVHLYILFNPWNKHDSIYMEDKEKRDEYVLNDVGKIWVGSYPSARGREWVFGQFDDSVLPACILLMERSGLAPERRGEAVAVTRAISRVVNSNDDRGCLRGRWDGDYQSGTRPSEWTGSIDILEQYLRKKTSVQYGQCWVFSGVTTTICRALGIPCRSVSNLNSAHDTNFSLSIDRYYNKQGEEIKDQSGTGNAPAGLDDSIWNFHVWNDVWMARPDLPDGYGGWQAIDATPQETSDGLYQCGPASHEAIRRGDIQLNYDVGFILSEVNADLILWQEDEKAEGGFKQITADKTHVGRQLLTKKPGPLDDDYVLQKDREDCTQDYKAGEGTFEERTTLTSAARRCRATRRAFRLPSVVEEDVEFEMPDLERVPIGQDFAIVIKMKNKSSSKRTVSLVLCASSEYYNGVKGCDIKHSESFVVLEPGSCETLTMDVSYKDYYNKLVEYAMMSLVAIAQVKETCQSWVGHDKFQVVKPTIAIKVDEKGKVGKKIKAKFSFDNPLDVPLKGCSLVIDGPGLTRPKKIPIEDVESKRSMECELKIYPKKSGTRNLVATFNSDQLVDVCGSRAISVLDD